MPAERLICRFPYPEPGDAADAGEERLPLLPAQEGLWFVEGGRPSAHNVSFALDLGGPWTGHACRGRCGSW